MFDKAHGRTSIRNPLRLLRLKVNKMNILANYATSYVGAFDLALSARERIQGEAFEMAAEKQQVRKGRSLIARLLASGEKTSRAA